MDAHATGAAVEVDPTVALDAAVDALAGAGFRLVGRTPSEAELTGPGMTSSRQDPLVGASRISLSSGGRLEAVAELGGISRMARFLRWFPPALGAALAVVLVAVFAASDLGYDAVIGGAVIPLVATSPWIILGPVIARSLRQRTVAALDTLVANAALGVPGRR